MCLKLQGKLVSKFFLFLPYLIFFVLLFNYSQAYAADNEPVDKRPDVNESRKNIEESKLVISDILSKKPFVYNKIEKIWSFKKEEKTDQQINPDMSWLTELVSFITMLVEIALWIIPVIVIFYLFRYREYWLDIIQGKKSKKDTSDIPETLFGLDIRQQSLPDDIQAEAHLLWQSTLHREAVSLLYRGALAVLFKQYRFDLPAGATEHDCIKQLERTTDNVTVSLNENELYRQTLLLRQFRKLTEIWVSVAYAHRIPDDVVFNEVCNNWNTHFTKDGSTY